MLPSLEEIKKKRLRLGLTQRKLARTLGISQSIIAKIEAGNVSPSYSITKKLFDYLEGLEVSKVGRARDVMSKEPLFILSHSKVKDAVNLMLKYGFSQLPVKDDKGFVVGSLLEKSITRKLLSLQEPSKLFEKRVEEIMDEPFPMVGESTPLSLVANLLQYFQAVLVVNNGKVKGIITNSDIITSITKKD
ncbi:MAG: CBS domain-containing protein [Nitrososphaerales archaeon]